MQDLFDVSKLEERRKAIRLPVGELCRGVGLNPSTWERVRAGVEPRLSTAKALTGAIVEAERELLGHLAKLHPDLIVELAEMLKRGEAA